MLYLLLTLALIVLPTQHTHFPLSGVYERVRGCQKSYLCACACPSPVDISDVSCTFFLQAGARKKNETLSTLSRLVWSVGEMWSWWSMGWQKWTGKRIYRGKRGGRGGGRQAALNRMGVYGAGVNRKWSPFRLLHSTLTVSTELAHTRTKQLHFHLLILSLVTGRPRQKAVIKSIFCHWENKILLYSSLFIYCNQVFLFYLFVIKRVF